MLEKIYINKPSNTDLNMYRCGIEDCSPGHSWGPGIRDHYIIHYILKGKGIFGVAGNTYILSKGDGFLITPGTIVYYQADMADPWSYSWVGFHGIKAESYLQQANLTADKPVFRYDSDDFLEGCLRQMIAAKDIPRGREVRLLGFLYIFLSKLIEVAEVQSSARKGAGKEMYVKKAVEFISMNYSRKITIAEIASHVGIDRSYLYSLFHKLLSTSPQQFLATYRIHRACELMAGNMLSIGDIARSVGYEDPFLFSKIFKKIKGLPPREYRKKQDPSPIHS